jgi:hypothetical protein
MKKNIINCLVILVLFTMATSTFSAIAQKESFKKTQFTLRGAFNMFSANGADTDYVAGTNDFPVTPAYSAPAFGIGLTLFTSPSFAIGIDVRYGLSAKVDLRDPSDQETVNVETLKNIVGTLSFHKYFELSKQMQLNVSLGGGAENLMANDTEYTGSFGSKVVVAAAKSFSPLAAAGIGFQYMFGDSLGVSVEFRGTYIFREQAQLIISPALALVLKF